MLVEAVDDHRSRSIQIGERLWVKLLERQAHGVRKVLLHVDRLRQHIDEERSCSCETQGLIDINPSHESRSCTVREPERSQHRRVSSVIRHSFPLRRQIRPRRDAGSSWTPNRRAGTMPMPYTLDGRVHLTASEGAPKKQPPRKLSGQRTVESGNAGKKPSSCGSPTGKAFAAQLRSNSQVHRQRGNSQATDALGVPHGRRA